MSDIKLFRVQPSNVEPIIGSAAAVERSLQRLIESHLEALLGVRFLATEFQTTKSHSGRIDTLGIDESNSPVIIEYKRAVNQNVINQGLFYLDWLLDHRADFKLLAMEKLGADTAGRIEWRAPRLICIAGDFTKFDQHAIQQMTRNIDLIRYRQYGPDLLLLEQIATRAVDSSDRPFPKISTNPGADDSDGADQQPRPTILERLEQCGPQVRDWYAALRAYAFGLGEGVHEHVIDSYIAFRALKNFAYITFRPRQDTIMVDLALSQFTALSQGAFVHPPKGKWYRVEVDSAEDVERIQPLIAESYQRT